MWRISRTQKIIPATQIRSETRREYDESFEISFASFDSRPVGCHSHGARLFQLKAGFTQSVAEKCSRRLPGSGYSLRGLPMLGAFCSVDNQHLAWKTLIFIKQAMFLLIQEIGCCEMLDK